MASGDTLLEFSPLGGEWPASQHAGIGIRNQRAILEYDDSTDDSSYWTAVMPQNYSGLGVDVIIHWAAVAVTGAVNWEVSWERIHATHDTDTDGFAAANVSTGNTVPATSGFVTTTTIAFTDGVDMDSVIAGDLFRIRLVRDTADTATGNVDFFALELEET